MPWYKDTQHDGKSNWKSFMHKFVGLLCSPQWSEIEQHDQFCFSLEGILSDYYTLLLDTDPYFAFVGTLLRFHKRFQLSASDCTHQINFQSESQDAVELLRQLADLVLTLAT
jgi:hypothetical protein